MPFPLRRYRSLNSVEKLLVSEKCSTQLPELLTPAPGGSVTSRTPVEFTPVADEELSPTPGGSVTSRTPVELTPVADVELTPTPGGKVTSITLAELISVELTPVESTPVELAPVELTPEESIPVAVPTDFSFIDRTFPPRALAMESTENNGDEKSKSLYNVYCMP